MPYPRERGSPAARYGDVTAPLEVRPEGGRTIRAERFRTVVREYIELNQPRNTPGAALRLEARQTGFAGFPAGAKNVGRPTHEVHPASEAS